MRFDPNKIFEGVQKVFTDAGFNDCIKRAKNAQDLSYRLIQWSTPLLVAALLSRMARPADAVPAK